MLVPLKITTDNSLLKSLIKVPSLINFLVELNIKACAIVDDNLYGTFDFYYNCKKNNIKPIIGLTININDFEIYLYAKDYQGFLDLIKINTIKENDEVTIDVLKKYKNNILVILPFKSKELFDELTFFANIYVGYSSIEEKNKALHITNKSVFINDIRAINRSDIKYLKYLDKMRKEDECDYSNSFYQEYDFIDEKIIDEIVNLLNVEISSKGNYIPKYNNLEDSEIFLKRLSQMGLQKRLNGNVSKNYMDRLNYELGVIGKMGFVDYFLIVYDYVLYAKRNNILVSVRGSAAGSLVSYAIGITDIDPLEYNLLFERFLNPERVTMPDIDIDFDATRREEVIEYVRGKYGAKNVALGLTFNTLKSKLVLREVGKLLKVDDYLIDKFVKSIDGTKSLKDNLNISEVKKYLMNYKELKEVYEVSIHLEGLKKNTSTHAAGVIISSESLDEIIPIHYENGNLITGVTMEYLEDLGLLKMDFLGLNNLTTVANITKNIDKNVLKDIDLNDKLVLDVFKKGKTDGIFQFETPMMKNLVQRLKPNSFSDLIAGVALGRPGPKDHAEEFILRKEKKQEIKYIHDDLKDILEETYGVIIYQEQIIAILGKIAGYTYGEADVIRRAISKKKEEVIKNEKIKFVNRAIKNGYDKNIAIEIYDLISKFASYGFNKSHSVAYAMLAYKMAFLKVHYPSYFFIELLNNKGSIKNSTSYINYLKGKGIKLNKPSINNNDINYYVVNNELYMPLWLIKNITKEIAIKILNAKKDRYTDIFDFCFKTKDFMTEDILKTLIKADAFSDFSLNKETLINAIPSALNYASLQDESGFIDKPILVLYESVNQNNKLDEFESFGFYITNHPSSVYSSKDYTKMQDIEKQAFKKIKCVVMVEKINAIKTKKNEDMAFFSGSDETDVSDFTVFPRAFNLLKNIKENDLVEVTGEVSKRFDKYNIIVNNIRKVG